MQKIAKKIKNLNPKAWPLQRELVNIQLMVVEPTATQAGLVFSSKLNLVVTFCSMTVTSAEQPGRWTHRDSDPL